MKQFCVLALGIFVIQSCINNNQQTTPLNDVSTQRKDSFFPVSSFIKGQMITLDSLPVTPLKITIANEKADSEWLSKEKLKPQLSPFLASMMNETNLTKYFKETKFSDQTLNAVTFTYDPIIKTPDSISLRHWDVYFDPVSGNVTKVYIVKEINKNNQLLTQQLTWQTNKRAKISTILNKPDGNVELLKQEIFIWNFAP